MMKQASSKDSMNSQIALQMYLLTVKFQIYTQSDENDQNKIFS